jgi:hypothetical protein
MKPGAIIQFRAEEIATDFGIGYAVTTGDVNGDSRTDVVAINATDHAGRPIERVIHAAAHETA